MENSTMSAAQQAVRERWPDLDPDSGPGAARRWNRLVRLAEVSSEYRAAQAVGERSPANAIAEARGVEAGTVRSWLHQARKEGFEVPHRVACNELGAAAERVAANVKRFRFARRLTTVQLAAAVTAEGRQMYATTVTKIEKLQRRVDVDDLVALAAALGVDPVLLLEEPAGCGTCHGAPPPGFACNDCGTGTPTPEPQPET